MTLAERILLLAPTRRDGGLARRIFSRAGIPCDACADVTELCAGIARGVGVVLITEESLSKAGVAGLALELERQLPWSDISRRPADTCVSASRASTHTSSSS